MNADEAAVEAAPAAPRTRKVWTLPSADEPIRVPPLLAGAAAWCWRLLVVAAAFYALFVLMSKLELLILPLFTAVLFAALLYPAVRFLRRWLPRPLATWAVIIIGFAILGAIGTFVVNSASNEYPKLVDQISKVSTETRHYLVSHFHLDPKNFDNVSGKIIDQLRSHQKSIASGVLSAGRTLADVVTAAILCFFITFFFLYDGERIWSWIVGLLPRGARNPMHGAGEQAWRALTGYVAGTFVVALFHGVAIGVVLLLLGVPLAAPLAVLVFIGSFIPIIGAVLFGGLAVVIALITKGFVAALIVLIVLVVDNQAEAHLLQPLVVGRYVSLHPLAIAVTLAGGAFLAGLPGAIFGVPVVAAVNAGANHLLRGEEPVPEPPPATEGPPVE